MYGPPLPGRVPRGPHRLSELFAGCHGGFAAFGQGAAGGGRAAAGREAEEGPGPNSVVVNTQGRESGGSWLETCSGVWYLRRRPCGVVLPFTPWLI